VEVSFARMKEPAVRSRDDAVRSQREVLFPWVKPYYEEPLVLARAEGVRVEDEEGREYLDLFAGILTTSVGHCHPRVVERVQDQVERLGHTSTLYVTRPQIQVAERLLAMVPGGERRVAFTNSGTEAVETAITAARVYTGRSEVVALRHAYSGRSMLAGALTAHAPWRPLPASVAGVVHARSPYPYRSPLGPDAPEEAQTDFFIDDLVEVIETTTSGRPAALMLEPVQGVGGFIVPPAGYVARAAEVIRRYGGVFISDEVQTGFGRTGGRWFGCEHAGVEPDILVMAKGIANGFPVGATVARAEIAEAWTSLSISTYGGNPVSMAAADATLEVMVEEDVRTRATHRGDQLRRGLEELARDHPWIGEVRGMGLMQALEIVQADGSREPDPSRARRLLEATREEGVLVGLGGLKGQVIRLGPSLLISESEVAEGLVALGRACGRVESAS
jgi:alanine-glyoxylate transaminase / (R)-3-amino-2-methylpropionate-pyruvate transaminase